MGPLRWKDTQTWAEELLSQPTRRTTHRDLPLHEGGNVLVVVEDGEGLQKVGFQPLPVCGDLPPRAPWCTTGRVVGHDIAGRL